MSISKVELLDKMIKEQLTKDYDAASEQIPYEKSIALKFAEYIDTAKIDLSSVKATYQKKIKELEELEAADPIDDPAKLTLYLDCLKALQAEGFMYEYPTIVESLKKLIITIKLSNLYEMIKEQYMLETSPRRTQLENYRNKLNNEKELVLEWIENNVTNNSKIASTSGSYKF